MPDTYPNYQDKSQATLEALTGERDKTGIWHITQHTSQASAPSLLAQLQRQFDRIHVNLSHLVDLFVVQESATQVGINPGDYRLGGAEKHYAGTTGLSPTNNATTFYYLDAANLLQSNTTGFPVGRTNILPLGEVVMSSGAVTSIANRLHWLQHDVPLVERSGSDIDFGGQALVDTSQSSLDLGDTTTAPKLANMTTTERDALTPTPGMVIWNTTTGQLEKYNGSSWSAFAGGVSDHGALTGLGDDDHSIYGLLAGRAGGQSLIGGTGSGESLTLDGTSHATHGGVRVADGNYLDVPEIVTPAANPAAGFNRLYFKSDDLLYAKDSDGNEQPINPHSILSSTHHPDLKSGLSIQIGQLLVADDDGGTTRFTTLAPGSQLDVLEVAGATGILGWKGSTGQGNILREDKPQITTYELFKSHGSDPGQVNIPTGGVAVYVKSGSIWAQKETDGSTQDLFAGAAVGAHNLLSNANHPDAATGTAVRGDIIAANSSALFSRLAIGANKTRLQSDGNDPAWSRALYLEDIADPASDAQRMWIAEGGNEIRYWDDGATPAKRTLVDLILSQTLSNKTFATSLLLGSDNAIDLGDSTNHLRDIYIKGGLVGMTQPRSIQVTLDGGGSAIAGGTQAELSLFADVKITKWRILEQSNNSGSITVDVRRCTYAQFDSGATHPVSGDSIAGTDKPTLSSAVKNESTALTGWDTTLDAGDVLWFVAEGTPTSVQKVTVELEFEMR
jgi:hypothetical protein